jgi:major type 1 subunit fimbrin (pilin)
MNICKQTLSLIAGAAALLAASHAFATDGTINITGSLTASTCQINGNEAGTATNVSVNLPTLAASSLATVGATAGVTPFQLNLTNCTGTSAQTHFEAGPTVDSTTGALSNQATTGASNVQVQVLNNLSQPINLSTNSNSQTTAVVNNTATMQYFARYFAASAAATPGAVNTSVMFSMLYN